MESRHGRCSPCLYFLIATLPFPTAPRPSLALAMVTLHAAFPRHAISGLPRQGKCWHSLCCLRAVTKPALPLAIAQEQSGMTLEDLIGKQPELVGEGGV